MACFITLHHGSPTCPVLSETAGVGNNQEKALAAAESTNESTKFERNNCGDVNQTYLSLAALTLAGPTAH